MAHAGQVLENPISGEKIIFRQTAADTDGELLAFELVLAPGGAVPGAHVHPEQEERFEVDAVVRLARSQRSLRWLLS